MGPNIVTRPKLTLSWVAIKLRKSMILHISYDSILKAQSIGILDVA